MNKNMKRYLSESFQVANGVLECQVVERGRVVRRFKPQKNLILNQGLNEVCATRVWGDCFVYAVAGTGTTATNYASGGGENGSGATSTFTGPGTFDFTVYAAVGDMLQMTSGASSGSEVRITSVTDATHVEYTPAGTLSSGEFAVYKTSQVGLTTEVKRTNTYLTGAGNCGDEIGASSVDLKRTFDFSAESGSVTYNEIGFSWTASVGTNLFSRIKLAVGVSLTTGQLLRVVYTLTINVSPIALTAITYSITGWPVAPSTSLDGDQQWQQAGIMGINTSGVNNTIDAGGSYAVGCMEPSYVSSGGAYATHLWLSSIATAPSAFGGTPIDRRTESVYQVVVLSAYTPLDFYRDKTTTFAVGDANRTDWRSMGLGTYNNNTPAVHPANNGTAFVCLFDEVQTKNSLYTLTLTFRITVGRVLA